MLKKLTILSYHGIGLSKNDLIDEYDVRLVNFKKQVKLLNKLGFSAKAVSEALAPDFNGKSKVVALTFDDAYLNVFNHALPILDEYKFTSSIYVVSNYVGKTNDWDKKVGTKKAKIMEWGHLKTAQKNGHEIGSHGHRHLRLANESENTVKDEITKANDAIIKNIGITPQSYAFSYGSVHEKALEKLEELHYDSALTIKNGRNLKSNRLLLQRVTIKSNDSLLSFWFKVKTGYSPVNFAKHLLKFLIGYNKNLHR